MEIGDSKTKKKWYETMLEATTSRAAPSVVSSAFVLCLCHYCCVWVSMLAYAGAAVTITTRRWLLLRTWLFPLNDGHTPLLTIDALKPWNMHPFRERSRPNISVRSGNGSSRRYNPSQGLEGGRSATKGYGGDQG